MTGEISTYYKSDSGYPKILRSLDNMPDKLYVKGKLPDPDRPVVAIVGARSCSVYGRNQAARYARILASHGVQIISGLAYGIDTAAHEGCLTGKGPTYAVLGCGIDICYPKENYPLYERILKEGGGILSEFEPGDPPVGWRFPLRNRLISGLADVILVIEAREKSGSLITVDYALDQGKTVYALPGRVSDSTSCGCNRLIAQGAGIAWCPEMILNELGLADVEFPGEKKNKKSAPEIPESGPGQILKFLNEDPKSFSRILEESKADPGELSRNLLVLVLDGQVLEMPPGYYCRKIR